MTAVLAGAFGVLAGLPGGHRTLRRDRAYGDATRNEIGVRIALGGGRGKVIALVLRDATLRPRVPRASSP